MAPSSTLALARRLIALRRETPALRTGDISFRENAAPVLAFQRDNILCAFNMSGEDVALPGDGEALLERAGPYGFRIAAL